MTLGKGARFEAFVSVQILFDIHVDLEMSICLGLACAGVQVVGDCQAATGIDLKHSISTKPWSLSSKLTSYAEYPKTSAHMAHHR